MIRRRARRRVRVHAAGMQESLEGFVERRRFSGYVALRMPAIVEPNGTRELASERVLVPADRVLFIEEI